MNSKVSNRQLMQEQLNEKVKYFHGFVIPEIGWIKTIRGALGISSTQLAKRCGISRQRLDRVEIGEVEKKTSLETLEKVAKQLECSLVYALVPKDKLSNIVAKQARKKALQQMKTVGHTMALENQAVSIRAAKKQLSLIEKELLSKDIKHIW
jgi:predicted DNA-binding mobile mystery protein A